MAPSTKVTGNGPLEEDPLAISEIRVSGFKSIAEEQKIEIRPLTILAGVNSSGKSSMMQPLLLLKQTVESPYDAGPILLNGPIIKFTLADQLFSRIGKRQTSGNFHVGIVLTNGDSIQTTFRKEHTLGLGIERTEIRWKGKQFPYWLDMTQDEIVNLFAKNGIDLWGIVPGGLKEGRWEIRRDRCFIGPVWIASGTGTGSLSVGARPGPEWEKIIPEVIHIPGVRSNAEPTYPVTAIGTAFSGTFQVNTASLISKWMTEDQKKLLELRNNLIELQLTGGVIALRKNDAQIELHVGRLPDTEPTGPENRVNIAYVGLGVSQVLPVLVGLLAAKPGQLIHVEQPETHLHPRAQTALATILANAAKRGVRVVVETHSSLLLLGIQTLVAEAELDPNIVKLYWFKRDNEGRSTAYPGNLDEAGRFGDWPEDFDDVTLNAQKEYLDASSKRLFAQ
jgi:predicted ATPase